MGSEIEIVDRIVYKNKNQHRRCSYFQYLLKVMRDLRLLQSAHIEEIVSSSFQVIHGTKPKQKVQLLESTAKAREHKKLRVCVDSAMELMTEVVMSILFPAALFLIFSIVNICVAVMTRTYPEDSGERKELILLQNIASYMLLACGAIYLISLGCVRGVLHALDYHHWHYNVKKLLPHKKHNGPRHVKGSEGYSYLLEPWWWAGMIITSASPKPTAAGNSNCNVRNFLERCKIWSKN